MSRVFRLCRNFSGEILALQGQGQGKGNGRGKPPKDNPIDPAAWFPRPVPIGVSTGHPCITAGTIGVRVKMPGNRLFALSNNHIYAGTNGDDPRCANLSIYDVVIQPGTADGGTLANRIGDLFAFVEIDFSPGAKNRVDAAIASTDDDLLGKATPPDGYGVPPTGSLSPADAIGQKAKKYGRTTGLTSGRVEAINATVNVGYGAVGVARFVGQIIISPGGFSAGGDSGSLILVTVTEGRGRNRTETVYSLGLLFAGGASITVANPIDDVLGAFGVTIDGN